MLAVTAYWMDENYKAQYILLAIGEIKEHIGENISAAIYTVIQEFDFIDRIEYFIGDNATNNNMALKALARCVPKGGELGIK